MSLHAVITDGRQVVMLGSEGGEVRVPNTAEHWPPAVPLSTGLRFMTWRLLRRCTHGLFEDGMIRELQRLRGVFGVPKAHRLMLIVTSSEQLEALVERCDRVFAWCAQELRTKPSWRVRALPIDAMMKKPDALNVVSMNILRAVAGALGSPSAHPHASQTNGIPIYPTEPCVPGDPVRLAESRPVADSAPPDA